MKSTLFAYSVDEDEGKLVITINGLLAEGLIKQIRLENAAGRGGEFLARLLPLGSLYKLMSSLPEGTESAALNIEQLVGQNIDQTFSSFEKQIAELKSSLDELRRIGEEGGKLRKSKES